MFKLTVKGTFDHKEIAILDVCETYSEAKESESENWTNVVEKYGLDGHMEITEEPEPPWMDLNDVTGQNYAVVETESAVENIDASRESSKYSAAEIEPVTLEELTADEDRQGVVNVIRYNSEDDNIGLIRRWKGKVREEATGTEWCIIYAPEDWF